MKTLLALLLLPALAACQTPINVRPPAPPVVQPLKMEIERIALSAETITGPTLSKVLAKAPAPNTGIVVFTRSSVFGSDQIDAAKPIGTTELQRRTIVITLPEHRPFTVADEVVIVYWTLE